MILAEVRSFPLPTTLVDSHYQAVFNNLLSSVLRFQDATHPLWDGHTENDLEHIESCLNLVQDLFQRCPAVLAEIQARYPDDDIFQDLVDMIWHHEDGEPFAGDSPKTSEDAMKRKADVKALEHAFMLSFVLRFLATKDQARIEDLYLRFEQHPDEDLLAQLGQLIDNVDGNNTSFTWRLTTGRERFTHDQIRRLVWLSVKGAMKPVQALLEHLESEVAREELLEYATQHFQPYIYEGLSEELFAAFLRVQQDGVVKPAIMSQVLRRFLQTEAA